MWFLDDTYSEFIVEVDVFPFSRLRGVSTRLKYRARSRLFARPPHATSSPRINCSISFRLRIASRQELASKRSPPISALVLPDAERALTFCPLHAYDQC